VKKKVEVFQGLLCPELKYSIMGLT